MIATMISISILIFILVMVPITMYLIAQLL